MAFPLLLLPLIGAAAGLGTQAARGKTGNKDLWRGALMGAGAGLGGAGLGAAAGAGTMMGGAGAAGGLAGATPSMAGGLTGALASGAAPTAAAVGGTMGGAGSGLGWGGLLSSTGAAMGKGAATSAGSTAAARMLTPEEEMVAEQYGMVPPMMQQQDPMALFAQLQAMSKGGMS